MLNHVDMYLNTANTNMHLILEIQYTVCMLAAICLKRDKKVEVQGEYHNQKRMTTQRRRHGAFISSVCATLD